MVRDKVLTFRVRRLPLQINKAEATQMIQEAVGADDTTVTVESLAVDLALSHTTRSKTATVTIVPLPPCLEGEDELSFKASYAESEYIIIFDRGFLGFTVLSDVDATEHIFDGLGSHPFGSWQHRGRGPPFMWLRDGLPKDIPGIRTIVYGYDSHVMGSSSFQRIYDLSRNLINGLTSFGFGTSASRPIVFIAHSLGGLLLKEALISLAAYSDQQFSVIRNVVSVINFGVPHKGMETNQLLTMVNGQPNAGLVQDLTPKSSYLSCIENAFNGIQHLMRFTVASFYETKTTKTVAVSSESNRVIVRLLTDHKWDGERWSRTGEKVVMVDRDSAIQRSSGPDEVYSVDEDHSSMVKFARDDVNYKNVLGYIKRRRLLVKREERTGTQNFEQRRALGFAGETSEPGARYRSHEEQPHRKEGESEKRAYSHREIIQSLNLDIFKRRETEITPNDPSTYRWVFQNKDLRLIHWFLKKEGVYWIHGKPGSGKSTLLKYIFSHPETSQALHQWSHSGTLIKAGFFFYHRGSAMQKTFYSLIRSLLFQILSEVPDLCDEIPRHCLSRDRHLRIEWTLSNLQDTLRAIFRQQRQELRICLFIDALDEFDGHLESLSEFIQGMITPSDSTKSRAKVFFSSRPRDILFNQFKHFPSFQLQQYTTDDIERYTIERLKRFPGVLDEMELSQTTRQAVSRVIEYINQTADGVFLWVRLALDKLSEAVTAQDSFTALDMNQLLRELPTELGDFYAEIIRRMPQDFRWNAYLILDTLLKAFDEPSLRDLHLIVMYSKCQTVQECERRKAKSGSFKNFCAQLREQCGGLIELVEPFRKNDRVRLMHETVREFVSQPAFQELIVGRDALFRLQNGYTELAKLQHCTMRVPNVKLNRVPASAVYHYLAEITTGASQLRFIDSLGGRCLLVHYLPDDPLTYAVYYGLSLFVQEKLSRSKDPRLYADKPLLHAVCLGANRFGLQSSAGGEFYEKFKPDYIRIAELLVNKGLGIPTYKGTRPLGNLLYFPKGGSYDTTCFPQTPVIMEMAELLLANGQDPNASSVLVGQENVTSWICRPLHISTSPITEILLGYGADINGRDRKGRTPIDVVIRRILESPTTDLVREYLVLIFLIDPTKLDSGTRHAVRTFSVLAEKGGFITRAGLILLFGCDPKLSSWDCTPHIPKMIQRSLKEGPISLIDLWMAKIVAKIRNSRRRAQQKDLRQSLLDEQDYY